MEKGSQGHYTLIVFICTPIRPPSPIVRAQLTFLASTTETSWLAAGTRAFAPTPVVRGCLEMHIWIDTLGDLDRARGLTWRSRGVSQEVLGQLVIGHLLQEL